VGLNIIINREKINKKMKKITLFSSSLLCPKIVSLCSAASLVSPSLLHLKFSKTSSMGMFSYIHKTNKIQKQKKQETLKNKQ